ncbi:choice-of-anchor J domain-containing protein [Flavobacterium selenitireducens]|uniref:choice-of-anchor J domain-containing protein n=1 Tax=Flavobacterium selenitireducens TaxID=2722704 RepID=UPI00168AE1C4|nr:choice-of-anchor J domain-containing protein [Flavobacterium selenitireducens]MBD3582035.1 DUF5017 domain-containing protein [Flavobacterium selenitireducens]
MKTFKIFGFLLAASAVLTSCVGEDDISLPNYAPTLLGEDFESGAADNTVLDLAGWENFNEVGTKVWRNQIYSGNTYAEFSSFTNDPLDKDPVNIGWLISPSLNMDAQQAEVLSFEVSQSYVSSAANKLEVFISTDYDGNVANIGSATWQPLTANIPGTDATFFEFQDSGDIDLSGFTGTAYLAFKVVGSGQDPNLDGSYQIDNVKITYQN